MTDAIRNCLEQNPDAINQICGPNARYVCLEEFVLEHGRQFQVAKLDKSIRRGKKKECYENIWKLVDDHEDDFIYVEGIGFNPLDNFGCVHAWAVDRDGKVVDPTWNFHPQTEYFGIPFDWEFVNWTMADTELFGILENCRPAIMTGKWGYDRASKFGGARSTQKILSRSSRALLALSK
jgi:hypothetical protein